MFQNVFFWRYWMEGTIVGSPDRKRIPEAEKAWGWTTLPKTRAVWSMTSYCEEVSECQPRETLFYISLPCQWAENEEARNSQIFIRTVLFEWYSSNTSHRKIYNGHFLSQVISIKFSLCIIQNIVYLEWNLYRLIQFFSKFEKTRRFG